MTIIDIVNEEVKSYLRQQLEESLRDYREKQGVRLAAELSLKLAREALEKEIGEG